MARKKIVQKNVANNEMTRKNMKEAGKSKKRKLADGERKLADDDSDDSDALPTASPPTSTSASTSASASGTPDPASPLAAQLQAALAQIAVLQKAAESPPPDSKDEVKESRAAARKADQQQAKAARQAERDVEKAAKAAEAQAKKDALKIQRDNTKTATNAMKAQLGLSPILADLKACIASGLDSVPAVLANSATDLEKTLAGFMKEAKDIVDKSKKSTLKTANTPFRSLSFSTADASTTVTSAKNVISNIEKIRNMLAA